LRTLASTRPWRLTLGSIAATGDGNYGAGQLTCHLTTDPTTTPRSLWAKTKPSGALLVSRTLNRVRAITQTVP
jgi:hypothetical protein